MSLIIPTITAEQSQRAADAIARALEPLPRELRLGFLFGVLVARLKSGGLRGERLRAQVVEAVREIEAQIDAQKIATGTGPIIHRA